MTISPDALIVLIGVWGFVQVTRATLTYRKAVRQPRTPKGDSSG